MKTFNKDDFHEECVNALSTFCETEDFTGHESAKLSILLSGMVVIHAITKHLCKETDEIEIINNSEV